MDNQQILEKALEFHGHRCWANVAGVCVGLLALVERYTRVNNGKKVCIPCAEKVA